MSLPTLQLTVFQIKLARDMARARHDTNRKHYIDDRTLDKKNPYKSDTIGYGGEIAFCVRFNACPDLTTEPRRGGHDCIFLSRKWDVKALKNPELLVEAEKFDTEEGRKRDEVEMYALLNYDWKDPYPSDVSAHASNPGGNAIYTFIGFATKEMVLNGTVKKKYVGEGMNYTLQAKQLIPFSEVYGFMKEYERQRAMYGTSHFTSKSLFAGTV